MARSASYHVPFRRRREGKTNYHRRKRLLRSDKPRIVVRRSNKHERVSFAIAKTIGDEIIAATSSLHLKKYGWRGATGNISSSYLTGYLAGKYAQTLGIKAAILDIGVNSCRKGTRVAAMLCGAVASGLEIPHNPEIFPSEERYTGKHIADFAAMLKKKNSEKYAIQFSGYTKRKARPESLPTYFKTTISAIDQEFASGEMKAKLTQRLKKNKSSKKRRAPTKPKKTSAVEKPVTKKTSAVKPKSTTPAKKTTSTTKKTTKAATSTKKTSTKKTTTKKKTTKTKSKK